jgi:hypothetical protein
MGVPEEVNLTGRANIFRRIRMYHSIGGLVGSRTGIDPPIPHQTRAYPVVATAAVPSPRQYGKSTSSVETDRNNSSLQLFSTHVELAKRTRHEQTA